MASVFFKDNRWCYQVDSIIQEWHPDKDGYVPMTEEEATGLSIELEQRMMSQQNQEDHMITRLDFMSRFTDVELVTIYSAAKSSVQIEVWLEKVKMATDISLTDPRTVSGIFALEQIGMIGPGRAKEVLTP